MVMGNCEGEQNTWQVAQRSPLAWAALSGCGYRNTWVECLKDSNAQLRKDLSKQLIGFAVRVPPPRLPPPFLPNTSRVSSPLRARLSFRAPRLVRGSRLRRPPRAVEVHALRERRVQAGVVARRRSLRRGNEAPIRSSSFVLHYFIMI